MSVILRAENITKSYGEDNARMTILNNIDLTVEKGEFISIMGPSGCGKSTLLYLLGGLEYPTSGNVFINNVDINSLNDTKKTRVRRKGIGFVFQFYNLVHNLSVEDNIMLPIVMAGKKTSPYREKLAELLEMVGLSDKKKQIPSKLSGGQQQRVSIARAIISEPNIILADEPIGNLDSRSGNEIMNLFSQINQKTDTSIVQVTHSEKAALFGSRLVEMKDGVIISNEKINS